MFSIKFNLKNLLLSALFLSTFTVFSVAQDPHTLYLLNECLNDVDKVHLGLSKNINIFDTSLKKKVTAPAGYKSIYPIIKNKFKTAFGKKLVIYNDKERMPDNTKALIVEVLIGGNYTTQASKIPNSEKELRLGENLNLSVSVIYSLNGEIIYQQSLASLKRKAKMRMKKIKEPVRLTSLIEPLKSTVKSKLYQHLKSLLTPTYKGNVVSQFKTKKNFFVVRRANWKMNQIKPQPKRKGWGLLPNEGDDVNTAWKTEKTHYRPVILFEVVRDINMTDVLVKILQNPFNYTTEAVVGLVFEAANANNTDHWEKLLKASQEKEEVQEALTP